MKITIGFNQFYDQFSDIYKNNFSYEGKKALFEYLENYEEETGEQLECDIISICCEFTEFDNLEELQASYPDIKSIEELQDNTQVIAIENIDGTPTERFIIQNY